MGKSSSIEVYTGPKMDPELKVRWVAALRSGEYEQGQGILRTEDDKYCCMGVLCDIVDTDRWSKGRNYLWGYTDNDQHTAFPPDSILAPNVACHLSDLNDYRQYSFDQIADWVEENL